MWRQSKPRSPCKVINVNHGNVICARSKYGNFWKLHWPRHLLDHTKQSIKMILQNMHAVYCIHRHTVYCVTSVNIVSMSTLKKQWKWFSPFPYWRPAATTYPFSLDFFCKKAKLQVKYDCTQLYYGICTEMRSLSGASLSEHILKLAYLSSSLHKYTDFYLQLCPVWAQVSPDCCAFWNWDEAFFFCGLPPSAVHSVPPEERDYNHVSCVLGTLQANYIQVPNFSPSLTISSGFVMAQVIKVETRMNVLWVVKFSISAWSAVKDTQKNDLIIDVD